MKDFLGFLFRFVLLPKQIAFLFGTQISPSQLIPANPRNGFFAILKSERHGRKADFGMFLKNRITVVTINKGVTPNDQRREQLAFFEDIFFKLLKFIIGQRRNLVLELRVDFQIDHTHTPLSLLLRRFFLRAVEQVNLVQSGTLAQLHDLDTQMPHGLGGAGVLHALTPIAGLLHIGLAFHLSHSDAADHDVDMDASRIVVPIRVNADDGRMTREVFFAEFQAKSLCLFHGQAVVGCISWVKADDILVAFDITMLGVLAIFAVCQQAGRCKREIAALKGIEQVGFPQLRLALFIQKLLPGERVVLVNEVRFDGGVVRVFITIRLFKSLATTSNCMSQICGLWLNNAAALATEAICLSVAIQFTQNFLGVEPECSQVCKFVKDFRPQVFGVCAAGVEVTCKLVEVSAHLAALGKQGGNGGQSFFATTGNDDCFLYLDVVDSAADKKGEIQEFASEFQ